VPCIYGLRQSGASVAPNRETWSRQSPSCLLLEDRFNLPELLLNFAGEVFGLAFNL